MTDLFEREHAIEPLDGDKGRSERGASCGAPTRTGGTCRRFCAGGRCAYHSGAKVSRPRRPLAERFWEKVDKRAPDECWLWMAFKCSKGYGRIHGPGRAGSILLASRVSYELHRGPIPPGLDVLHSCDNPPCVNPAHLRAGTEADNMWEMTAKGRNKTLRGDDHPFRRDREKYLPLMRENARRSWGVP